MTRQVPHAEDLATGATTAGLVPVSAGPGLPAAWGAGGGGGGGGGGAWTEIAHRAITAPTDLVTFDAIPQTFRDLVVVAVGRTDQFGGYSDVNFLLNNDPQATSNYPRMGHYADQAGGTSTHTVSSGAFAFANGYAGSFANEDAAAGASGCVEATFFDYTGSTFTKRWHSRSGTTIGTSIEPNNVQQLIDGYFTLNTDPITRIDFFGGGNFLPGTVFTLYGRGGSGGGGGSSSTLLYEVTATGGETSLRLPASGSLPAGYKGLLLLWQVRGASSGSSNVSLQLRLNDDTASHYRHMDFAARSSGSTGAEGNTAGLPSSTRFYAARVTPTTAPAGAAAAGRLWLPQASRSTFWQPILSESSNSYWDGVDTQMVQSYGHWMQAAAITSITVLCLDEPSAEPLEAGSYFAVYGIQ